MGFIWLLIGIVGGVLGGMGMGGGTLLIPLLTGLGGVDQHIAQAVNLIAFVPMSGIALWIHYKNGYVRVTGLLPMILSAVVSSAVFAVVAQGVDASVLKTSFGIFLTVLGSVLLFLEIWHIFKKNDEKKKKNLSAC